MRRLTPSESAIQAGIVAWLRYAGFSPVKLHNEGKRHPGAAAKLKREGLHPGAADLVVPLDKGRVLWIECKSKAGRLSETQKSFRVYVEAKGHVYCLARCLEDVQEALLRMTTLEAVE